jgi:AraC family transcriptional regulator
LWLQKDKYFYSELMRKLSTGQFFGQTNETIVLEGITITDTEYTIEKVDWHYHENPYFTFILEGNILEGNKKETFLCNSGSLLYHNWQDPHYNIKPKGYTRGFHIELNQSWYDTFHINADIIEGSRNVLNPQLKLAMYSVFKETKIEGSSSELNVNSLLLNILGAMTSLEKINNKRKPAWVAKIREVLHDSSSEKWTLHQLAEILQIHPVHLSRDFPKYFLCNIGEYVRNIKVQRALNLLSLKKYSLTDIAYQCGFSDQSHFLRCFKAVQQIRPSQFKSLFNKK